MSYRTRVKSERSLSAIILILGLILVGYLGVFGISCFGKVSEGDYLPALWSSKSSSFKCNLGESKKYFVLERANELFDEDITVKQIVIPFLNNFLDNYNTYEVRGRIKDFPYPSRKVIAAGEDEHTFLLPEEFCKLIEREKISIDSEKMAKSLAKGYILIKQDEDLGEKIIFPEQAGDIPWQTKPDYSEDPTKYSNVMEPPEVSFCNGDYSLSIYTWNRVQGIVSRWKFLVTDNGCIGNIKREKLASYVGDCVYSIYV